MEVDLKLGKRSRELDQAICESVPEQRCELSDCMKKRRCFGVEIEEDAGGGCVVELDDSEGEGCFDEVELDEAHERLVFGVMRSLEEELRIPRVLSPSGHLYENDTLPAALDSERFPSDEYDYMCQTAFSSPIAENSADQKLLDLPGKASEITNQGYPLSICRELHTEQAVEENPLHQIERIDIEYLLEASDDELGISPSPRSETSNASGGSSCDSFHPQLCDWPCGGYFDVEFENDPAKQAPSIWTQSSLDDGVASLESACAGH